jgi:predicted nucleic acid-binding protein
VSIAPVVASALVQQLLAPGISLTDATVVACAIEKKVALVLADDARVRALAEQHRLAVIGTVGLLVQARRVGIFPVLKPLLDQLVSAGFHLDPHGHVYQEALRNIGEAIT